MQKMKLLHPFAKLSKRKKLFRNRTESFVTYFKAIFLDIDQKIIKFSNIRDVAFIKNFLSDCFMFWEKNFWDQFYNEKTLRKSSLLTFTNEKFAMELVILAKFEIWFFGDFSWDEFLVVV